MATTITTDNVKTIHALDAVTSLADADNLIVWDSTNSAHKKITRADLQTDIASRSAGLTEAKATTTAGTAVLDAKAIADLMSAANTWTGNQTFSGTLTGVFQTTTPATNLNTVSSGIYCYTPDTSNTPAEYGICICFVSGVWIFQVSFCTTIMNIYYRYNINNQGFSSWRTI